MKLRSRVKFVDERLMLSYRSLEKGDSAERGLYNWLNNAFGALEENVFRGIQIQKRLVPKSYLKKYAVDNLWKFNLPQGWRLLYSIRSDDKIVVAVTLEWLSHKDYERRFGY